MKGRRGARLTNGEIAELLAAEGENASYPVERAVRKAGREAFLWPKEAAEMASDQQSLTELKGVVARVDLIKLAGEAGVMVSLGTDSHHPWQLKYMDLGLAAAVMGGISESAVLNFKTARELLDWSGALGANRS